eukprot:scaffold649367_cov46-Prasinocladus_malaysianus.AAC.1
MNLTRQYSVARPEDAALHLGSLALRRSGVPDQQAPGKKNNNTQPMQEPLKVAVEDVKIYITL